MSDKTDNNPLLEVRDLRTYFPVRGGLPWEKRFVRAVDSVSFSVHRGKTLGLVGESGSGKTTVGRTLLRLIPAFGGQVNFDGKDVFAMEGRELTDFRRRAQIIFQDPVGSLDPRMTVGDIVAEPLCVHKSLSSAQRREEVARLLTRVGLSSEYASRYPHEFSGGQRQRIGIARALASGPEFIVCDEPVSALDVSIQAQILNLLSDLQDEFGISYLFIAHNLAVVEHFADRVAVMYLGRIVEVADRDELYSNPVHPYTTLLLSSVPVPDPSRVSDHVKLAGETPSPINPPPGCPFHPRCPLTRRVAATLAENLTTEVTSGDETFRVACCCTEVTPSLSPLAGDSSHAHACTLLQADESGKVHGSIADASASTTM